MGRIIDRIFWGLIGYVFVGGLAASMFLAWP